VRTSKEKPLGCHRHVAMSVVAAPKRMLKRARTQAENMRGITHAGALYMYLLPMLTS